MSGSRRNIETGIERKNISNCVKVTTLAHHLNLSFIPTKTKPVMLSKSGCLKIHCMDIVSDIYFSYVITVVKDSRNKALKVSLLLLRRNYSPRDFFRGQRQGY